MRRRVICFETLSTRLELAVDHAIRNPLGSKPVRRPALVLARDLLQHARRRRDEAQVRAAGIQHARQVLGVELDTHEPGVVLDLDDLHADALLVLADKVQPALLQAVDVGRVDFVAVPVALEDLVGARVQGAQLGPLGARLEERGAQAQAHRGAHGGLVHLGHEHDELVGRVAVELLRRRVLDPAHVARVLDDRDLHAQAHAEVGLLVLARPRGGGDHALCGAGAEATGDEDARGLDDLVPGVVELGGVGLLHLGLEVVRVDPADVELALAAHGGVLERLDDGEVRVLELDVLTDESDGDRVVEAGIVACQGLPLRPDLVTLLCHGPGDGDLVQGKEFADKGHQLLLLQEHGHLVDGGHVLDHDNLLRLDLAEVGQLLDDRRLEFALAAAGDLHSVSSSPTGYSSAGI